MGDKLPFGRGGVIGAAGYAVNSNIRILRLTGRALGQVFTGKRSVRNTISGPIGICERVIPRCDRLRLGGSVHHAWVS